MKKTVAAFFALIALLSLSSCGNTATVSSDTNEKTAENTEQTASNETVLPGSTDESYYYGTWAAVRYEQDGAVLTTESAKNNDNYNLSHTGFVLRDDGQYYFYLMINIDTGEWKKEENEIILNEMRLTVDGQTLALQGDNYEIYFEKISEDTTFPTDREIDSAYFCGTWGIIGKYDTSSKVYTTLAKLKESFDTDFEFKIVFSDEGKCCISIVEDNLQSEWSYSDGEIQIEGAGVLFLNDLIAVKVDDSTLYIFEKVSDDQSFPETISETAEETGLRPEFKEAMDSYEAFYDEYCEILRQYTKNPSDLSILSSYMQLMGKLTEMDEKFEAWESEDLNSEEMQYYLEVSNRVLQKLAGVTG